MPKPVLKISHIVDVNQNFQTVKASQTADYCFCTTELIKDRLLKSNPKVYKINHGFNFHNSTIYSTYLPGKSDVKAVYAGNLAIPFVDWILINSIVNENPGVDFVFIGPNNDLLVEDTQQNIAKQKVLTAGNTFFIGKVEGGDLHHYLIAGDLLLVAYQEKYHTNQAANPHKMMEYLGSGKMILATYTDEFKDLAEKRLFLMSRRNCDFPLLFKEAVNDLEFWNSDDSIHARREFALDNTYSKQIERIERIMTK